MFACGSLAIAAAAACATSNDEVSSPAEDDAGTDAKPAPVSDAAAVDASVDDGTAPPASSCSDAGWCATPLPDFDLVLRDIWPLEKRAFALAESATLGTKVLEWNDATEKWVYIDDNSQNAFGAGQYAGKIWAPSETEVYFTVAPSLVYHGRRTTTSSPWTWEPSRLPYTGRDGGTDHDPGLAQYSKHHGVTPRAYPALGVWGTSPDDVYAWYANTIFHWRSDDGGAPDWVAEYVADDAEHLEDTFFVFAATGSGSDVWFAGGRGRYDATGAFACAVVIHKSPDGYRRVVDHEINPSDSYSHYSDTCWPKADAMPFMQHYCIPQWGCLEFPFTNGGWLTSITSPRPGSAAGILNQSDIVYVGVEDGGVATFNGFGVSSPFMTWSDQLLNSIWIHESETWISGWGMVLNTDNDPDRWSSGTEFASTTTAAELGRDAATYSYSTTVIHGLPILEPIYQVRGTSNTNLWAVGARYALHKTTP